MEGRTSIPISEGLDRLQLDAPREDGDHTTFTLAPWEDRLPAPPEEDEESNMNIIQGRTVSVAVSSSCRNGVVGVPPRRGGQVHITRDNPMLLLLEMYTLNVPSSGLSLWPLHYQALAPTVELGLHWILPKKVDAFQEQMRIRVFWSVYAIDRLLSTLMGRTLGVVDEQCDLRVSENAIPS